jgi:hypothetical protein
VTVSPKDKTRSWALAVVAGVLAVCILACAACAVSQPAMQRWPLGFGYVMSFCVVLQGPPQAQVGVRWVSPFISSAVPPFGGPANGCYMVPWLPFLPPRGAIVFPP